MVAETAERRRHPRVGVTLPVRVQGYLEDGSAWEEISSTSDVSAGGASFPLARQDVLLGQVLLLSLALPKRMRHYDLNDASYRVYSLVRSISRSGGRPKLGVMFFGKYPPRGFHERPSMRFLLPGDALASAPMPHETGPVDVPADRAPTPPAERPQVEPPPAAVSGTPPAAAPAWPAVEARHEADDPLGGSERRDSTRLEIFVNFTLSMVDANGDIREELTVADNVSRGGARVMTTLAFNVGDIVLLRELRGDFSTRAEVRAISKVQAAFDRLHLRFLDKKTPDRLLRL